MLKKLYNIQKIYKAAQHIDENQCLINTIMIRSQHCRINCFRQFTCFLEVTWAFEKMERYFVDSRFL